jgi:hypothetical protein
MHCKEIYTILHNHLIDMWLWLYNSHVIYSLFVYETHTKHSLKCDGNGENMNEDGIVDKVNVSLLLDDIEKKVYISLCFIIWTYGR